MHERTRAELIGFFNDYSNLTDVCTLSSGGLDSNLDRQFDAGKANVYGIEASASRPATSSRTSPVISSTRWSASRSGVSKATAR